MNSSVADKQAELREVVRQNLPSVMEALNAALRGEGLDKLAPIVARIARGGMTPAWFNQLRETQTIPNRDGKTVGSVLEMLLVAVLETGVLAEHGVKLRVNPARGIDLPDLGLGIKSPSRNFCTSEPFFSAYERLYGLEHDCLVLLTDYQEAKGHQDRFQLQIEEARYLKASEIADRELCKIAKQHRDWLIEESESLAKRVFKFLAYVIQNDWRAKWLVELTSNLKAEDPYFDACLQRIEQDFVKKNREKLRDNAELIPESDLVALRRVFAVTPRYVGVINELENWVIEFHKDASRAPNDNEWARLTTSPLDGKIGLSFALQWRFNFGAVFRAGAQQPAVEPQNLDLLEGCGPQ